MEPREVEELLRSHLHGNDLLQEEPLAWTIDRSSLGGRGMFATRNIAVGELIFMDAPLLIGPRCCNKYLPLCIVCYRNKCPLFPCDHGCGLPICSTMCENSSAHARAECRFLREWTPTCGSSWSMDLLPMVVAIRALTLSMEQRKLLFTFECHSNLIRNFENPKFRNKDKNIEKSPDMVDILHRKFN